jgi:hypothetical protein
MSAAVRYDLLLTGGHVTDSANPVDGLAHVAVRVVRIVAVGTLVQGVARPWRDQ